MLNAQQLTVNIMEPKISILELASQTTLIRNTSKCFVSNASYLLVFLMNKRKGHSFKLCFLFCHIPDVEAGEGKTQEAQDN